MKTFSSISLRLLAVILCLALIVVTLPQALFSKAEEVFGLNEPESRVTEENEMTAFVLGEMADERTARTKTFRMSNGSFLLANYAEPVHFVDAGGKWMDYDNTLKYIETESSSGYENTASDVQMRFSVCPEGGELVSLQSREYTVHMSLLDASPNAKVTVTNTPASPEATDIDYATTLPNYSSSLVYEEIAKDTDLQYILSGGSLKENILIKERTDTWNFKPSILLQHNQISPHVL